MRFYIAFTWANLLMHPPLNWKFYIQIASSSLLINRQVYSRLGMLEKHKNMRLRSYAGNYHDRQKRLSFGRCIELIATHLVCSCLPLHAKFVRRLWRNGI